MEVGMPDHAGDKAILTFVTPAEQQRIEAAGAGCYTAVHRENFDDMLLDMRTRPVSAIVVSVARYQQQHASSVARLVREFPGVPAVALLTASEARATQAVLSLGQQGVRTLVDAREPAGWRDLRAMIGRGDPLSIEAIAKAQLLDALPQAGAPCRRLLMALFDAPFTCTTVRQFARAEGVTPTTFMTRFFRAGLPPAKRYLAYARLVRAARILENPGFSLTQVAFQIEYSSPQALSRHLHALLHMSAAEFRQRYTGLSMLERMRVDLIDPYRDALCRFDPFNAPPQWLARQYPAQYGALAVMRTGSASSPPSSMGHEAVSRSVGVLTTGNSVV
jgi:AraC-like DNA-binding protein